jgi:hypothetical protein
MLSKAALFLEATKGDYEAKDYVPKALNWWGTLSPAQQKRWLAKLPPAKVTLIYKTLYGSPVSTSEDMSKTKKIITAAALAAFLLSGVAQAAAPTKADYDRYDKSHVKYSEMQPTQQQKEYSREIMKDKEEKAGPSIDDVVNVGKGAVDVYGTPRAQEKVYKTSQEVDFITQAIKVLTGQK